MEDPMDENEDDNLDQGWKLEERKTKMKMRKHGWIRIFGSRNKKEM